MEEQKKKHETIIESTYSLSSDGNYIIHKTIITDIRHINYVKKILTNQEEKKDVEQSTQ